MAGTDHQVQPRVTANNLSDSTSKTHGHPPTTPSPQPFQPPRYLCGEGRSERKNSYWQYLVQNQTEPTDEYGTALEEIDVRNRTDEIEKRANKERSLHQAGATSQGSHFTVIDFAKESSHAQSISHSGHVLGASSKHSVQPFDGQTESSGFVALKSAIRTYSEHVETRIVYVKAKETFDRLPTFVLDALAFEFDLDPRVFCKILQPGKREPGRRGLRNHWPLDAESSHFEFQVANPRDDFIRQGSRIFGCFSICKHPVTRASLQKILVLSEVDFTRAEYTHLSSVHDPCARSSSQTSNARHDPYINALLRLTKAQISDANQDPRLYVRPVADILVNNIRTSMTFEVVSSNWSHKIEGLTKADDTELLSIYTNLARLIKTTIRDFRHVDLRWTTCPSGTVRPPVLQTQVSRLTDYLEILDDHQQSIDLRNQRQLQAEQLQEAKKSTLTAINVGRLTQVAFVFIPLSFVTSFFGMNLREFDDGKALSYWHFLIAAGICLMLFPFLINYSPGRVTVCAMKLVLHSPLVGLYFILLVMANNRPIVKWFCDTFVIPWASCNWEAWNYGTPLVLRTRVGEICWDSTLYTELPSLNDGGAPKEHIFWMGPFSRFLAKNIFLSLYPKEPGGLERILNMKAEHSGLYPRGIRSRIDCYLWKNMESWRLVGPVYEDTKVPEIEIQYLSEDDFPVISASSDAGSEAAPRYRSWLDKIRRAPMPATSAAEKP